MTRYMLINELIIQSELNLHSMKNNNKGTSCIILLYFQKLSYKSFEAYVIYEALKLFLMTNLNKICEKTSQSRLFLVYIDSKCISTDTNMCIFVHELTSDFYQVPRVSNSF